jgi:hypothetical protein
MSKKSKLSEATLLLVSALVIIIFLLLLTFGPASNNQGFGLFSQKKTEQTAKASEAEPAASISVLPETPKPGGSQYTIFGKSFTPGRIITISSANPDCCVEFDVQVNGEGEIAFNQTTKTGGNYQYDALYKEAGALIPIASLSFEVR